jgi:hypothetical protein
LCAICRCGACAAILFTGAHGAAGLNLIGLVDDQ